MKLWTTRREPCKGVSPNSRKALALSLCVSLWMAGGSVASAELPIHSVYIDADKNNALHIDAGAPADAVKQGADGVSLTVTGDWPTGTEFWRFYGGNSSTKLVDGYTLILDGAKNVNTVYGGYSPNQTDKIAVSNNTVILKNSSTTGDVNGGYADDGGAFNNQVTMIDSKATEGSVYGGYGSTGTKNKGVATGNTVTLTKSEVAKDVCGGASFGKGNPATGNTVSLTDSTVGGTVYGGDGGDTNTTGDLVTGNTLNLSGVNTAAGIQNFETINITGATWGKPVMTLNGVGIVQNKGGSKAKIDASTLEFKNPETVPDGAAMNLIECKDTATITADFVKTSLQEYTLTPVTGMLVNAALQGELSLGEKALVFTASNQANKLTFTDVEWKDTGALFDHAAALTNITFSNAAVDTSNINFTNIRNLAAGRKMTLISDFGDSVGTIVGTKYKVGSTLEGMGKASLVGNDLIFTTETSVVQEQTHNTVMGAEAGMAALSAGNDFVGAATEGLGLVSNIGADGVSSYANMGGGSMRQETGSHVDTHTWNAILAIGHENKKGNASFQYGAFFEYGTGNYTTFNGDERGDGSTHYTGGGFLAKYTMRNNVYVEGSLRAGSIHDDARNVLWDDNGAPYSYETNAPYFGAHVGVGKEIPLTNGNVIDVYGKYFFNRRNGVSFDAGGCYDLDAVTSQVLRVGARYTVKRDKWNFYGGLAYEHELDGEATGKADGAPIRGADTKGGSFRGEIGATMTPGENSPWSLDLNLSGFAGKKQGFTGGVSVAFMF